MKIYLAGNVPKGKEEADNFVNWRLEYAKTLKKYFDNECIDPFDRNLDEADFMQVFGADCNHIKNCAFVIVNAEQKMGVGTAQEMVIAKYFKKPVVSVLPKDTHHRKSNLDMNGKIIADWIHPFIFAFSDYIIEDISEVEKIHSEILTKKPKDISMIDEGVEYFLMK